MYYLYILYSPSIDRYYTGITNDVQRRLARHNKGGKKYTTRGIPWELMCVENYSSRKEAETRERYLKSKKTRKVLEDAIATAQANK
jgi:putative endonuclease